MMSVSAGIPDIGKHTQKPHQSAIQTFCLRGEAYQKKVGCLATLKQADGA